MDEKNDRLESVPLVDEQASQCDEQSLRVRYGRKQQRNAYFRYIMWFLALESMNVFLFLGIPDLVKRQNTVTTDSLDEREYSPRFI